MTMSPIIEGRVGFVTVFECRVMPDEMPKLAFPYPDELLRSEGSSAHFEWDEAWSSPQNATRPHDLEPRR